MPYARRIRLEGMDGTRLVGEAALAVQSLQALVGPSVRRT
jgi:hypothetical protein